MISMYMRRPAGLRLTLAGLLAFFIHFQARAQVFEPGLVVTLRGDTLRGEVENNYWKETPKYLRFRATATQPSVLYRPGQLRAVSFPKGRYFRLDVLPLPPATTQEWAMAHPGDTPVVPVDSVLAEVLIDGPATLRRVVSEGTAHYFVQRPGRPVLEMSVRRKLAQNSLGRLVSVDGNDYRNQLSLYFLDCPAAGSLVAQAPFKPEALAAIVQAYNQQCTPSRQPGRDLLAQSVLPRLVDRPKPTVPALQGGVREGTPISTNTPIFKKPVRRSTDPRAAFQAGVLLGVRYNRLRAEAGCVDCRLRPWGGFYADLLQPSRRTAVYGELSLSSFGYQRHYYAANSRRQLAGPYSGTLGTARLGLRFFLPLPRESQLLLGLGFELNRVMSFELPEQYRSLQPVENGTPEFADPVLFPYLTLGWRYQRLTLSTDAQMYNPEGLTNYFVSKNTALRLSAAYRLGRNPDAPKP